MVLNWCQKQDLELQFEFEFELKEAELQFNNNSKKFIDILSEELNNVASQYTVCQIWLHII